MKVLLLHVEFPTPDASKHWPYHLSFGLGDALRGFGIEVVECLIKDWATHSSLFIERGPYSACIINDLVHGVGLYPKSIYRETIQKIKSVSKILVALVGESIYGYRTPTGEVPDFVQKRIVAIEPLLDLFDCFVLMDLEDAEKQKMLKEKQIFEYKHFIPEKYYLEMGTPPDALDSRYMFMGHVNSYRMNIFRNLKVSQLCSVKIADEDANFWIPYHEILSKLTSVTSYDEYVKILELLRNIRLKAQIVYLKVVSRFYGLVHLPTYWRGLHPRFLDAAFTGRVPILPYNRDFDRLGIRAGIDYAPFDPSNPLTLVKVFEELGRGDYKTRLSEKARQTAIDHFNEYQVWGGFIKFLRNFT